MMRSHTTQHAYTTSGISAFVFLFNLVVSFLQFEKAWIVEVAYPLRQDRVLFYARLNGLVSILTLALQLKASGVLIQWLGTIGSLAIVPLVSVVGFLFVGANPGLPALSTFWVVFKCIHYAISKPTREILFTPLPSEVKFSCKSFMDTFVYKAGRAFAATLFASMQLVSMNCFWRMSVAIAVCLGWTLLAIVVGRLNRSLLT